jgi:hypothetical protein
LAFLPSYIATAMNTALDSSPPLTAADQSLCAVTRDLLQSMTGPAPGPKDGLVPTPATVVVALAGFNDQGVPLVSLPGHAEPIVARTTVAVPAHAVGREVLVVHESLGVKAPIIVGVILDEAALLRPHSNPPLPTGTPFEIEVDGERTILHARQQLVLRCGEASITLTREGKILLRGAYVSSRSEGVNRITGGTVEIN